MLVLTRRNHESVVVGEANGFEHLLKVTVLDVKRGKVRLGFEVDKEVAVHRSEVLRMPRQVQVATGDEYRDCEDE